MREVVRHERAGVGHADGDIVTDLECELVGEHPGHLIDVAVQMEDAFGAGGQGFLDRKS
jgi:FKBP-type peptidyl-prolyl cis-trans isomerase 2